MDSLNEYRAILKKILTEYASIPFSHGDIHSTVIVSEDKNHYLLMNEGWDGPQRVHACMGHFEFRDGKLWIHHDGIGHGIADELVEAGIAKDHIVLAFHPPYIRPHTGYAIA
jgi:hypothetical protein